VLVRGPSQRYRCLLKAPTLPGGSGVWERACSTPSSGSQRLQRQAAEWRLVGFPGRLCDPIFFWGPNRATPSAQFFARQFSAVKSALAPLPSAPRIFSVTPPSPPKFAANFSSQTLCSFQFIPQRLASEHSLKPPPAPHIAASSSAPSSHY